MLFFSSVFSNRYVWLYYISFQTLTLRGLPRCDAPNHSVSTKWNSLVEGFVWYFSLFLFLWTIFIQLPLVEWQLLNSIKRKNFPAQCQLLTLYNISLFDAQYFDTNAKYSSQNFIRVLWIWWDWFMRSSSLSRIFDSKFNFRQQLHMMNDRLMFHHGVCSTKVNTNKQLVLTVWIAALFSWNFSFRFSTVCTLTARPSARPPARISTQLSQWYYNTNKSTYVKKSKCKFFNAFSIQWITIVTWF